MITTQDETHLTDAATQAAVHAELAWTSDVDATHIGVAVLKGVVTLSGQVGTYPERRAATRAAFRVQGVRSIADAIVVHHAAEWNLTDTDVASAIRSALDWSSDIPATVSAEVRDQVVTLTGEVTWDFERAKARQVVERIKGVREVRDELTLAERPSVADAHEHIRAAIVRNATVDASAVQVEMRGNVAVLTGKVRSWAERSQAGKAAWSSPHVTGVDNQILVGFW